MTLRIDRRSLLLTGSLGLSAYAIPGFAQSLPQAQPGFTHSVASGEPSATSILLWTRYLPVDGADARVEAQISTSADFTAIVARAEATTGPWRDHTVKVVLTGLEPGTDYFYRFVPASGGAPSPTGRTKTLPEGNAERFGIAVFSCSNLPFGYFNAYGHAATRDDIDLWVHLGDYFYEYPRGGYAPAGGAVDGRWPAPEGELFHLADYRLRYASYRSDPDLQALHAMKPMIASWDDHESANDSWEGGAQNHQSDEGDWSARKQAAMQVYREWMPVSDAPWATYDIGTLATFFRTETRLLGRTRPPELAPAFMAENPVAALTAFRNGSWQDPAMSMMGSEQEAWLAGAMARSVRDGRRWQLVGFGTIMGDIRTPANAAEWLAPDAPERLQNYVRAGIAASQLGLPNNMDSWGGYPAARARFLKSAQVAEANLVVLCGDSHNAWAFDLAHDGSPAGVEFAGHAVSSPGYESALGVDPRIVAAGLVDTNPELKWCDTSHRGYMAVTVTPERVTNDWLFVETITERNPAARVGHRATVLPGRNVMT